MKSCHEECLLWVSSGHSQRYYSNGRLRAYCGRSAAISIGPDMNVRFRGIAVIQSGLIEVERMAAFGH